MSDDTIPFPDTSNLIVDPLTLDERYRHEKAKGELPKLIQPERYMAADIAMVDRLCAQVQALTKALADAQAERDVFAKAIEQEALIQVQNELNNGEECPDTWRIGVGGVVVEVQCADASAIGATIQR